MEKIFRTEAMTQPSATIHQLICRPSRPVAPTAEGSTLRLLRSKIVRVRLNRDYRRVEAKVMVTFQYHPSLPPRTEVILTSVPVESGAPRGSLRRRLIKDALQLAVLMHRADQEEIARVA